MTENNRIIKIGHRGAAGHSPENTLASFQKALDLKVDMIEFDLHLCKSGELVVMHDEELNRTTNGQGYISQKTLPELKSLKIDKYHSLPTAEEVLDLINHRVKVNLELKGARTAEPSSELVKKYLSQGWQADDFLVSSFNHDELRQFKSLMPEIKIGALIKNRNINYGEFDDYPLYSVNINFKQVNQEFVNQAHQLGLKVFVYTVDDRQDILIMQDLGVDGIFSNYPDRL